MQHRTFVVIALEERDALIAEIGNIERDHFIR